MYLEDVSFKCLPRLIVPIVIAYCKVNESDEVYTIIATCSMRFTSVSLSQALHVSIWRATYTEIGVIIWSHDLIIDVPKVPQRIFIRLLIGIISVLTWMFFML